MARSFRPPGFDPSAPRFPGPGLSRRRLLLSLGALTSAAAVAAAAARLPAVPGGALVEVKRTGRALGAQVAMTVLHRDPAAGERALTAAFAELDRVDDLMSVYRPASQVSRLNRDGRLHDPHPCLVEVLRAALAMSARTGGAFDVTVGPLWQAYAAAQGAGHLPEPAAVREALERVGWRNLIVAPDRVRLAAGMSITLNGIAQGYAADRALAALRAHGAEHALVDTGEVGSIGRNPAGDAWSAGIQHPRRADAYIALVRLDGRCISTSGDYATTFTPDRSANHIFDPATGRSPGAFASVTVVAPTGIAADALSTAVFVLGPERGLDLIRRTPGADALVVLKDERVLVTDAFPRA